MAANVFFVEYKKWYLNYMGDWDFERHEDRYINEEVRNIVAERLQLDKKIVNNSVKCFTRIVTDQEYERICDGYN